MNPLRRTHWSFSQLSSLVGAPEAYLRQLPAPLAGINLQYGLTNHRAEQIKTLETDDGRTELRAVTGPDYGRIYDHELVSAVQRIAGNGTGDTRWKVPGVLDWSTGIYNPRVDVTKETTTLYASDRDVFLFLVDDLNPIEAGLLPDGSPDLYFRGFYSWNSEVGAKTLGIASFYLRAVCQNRNLWGVEDFQEITIRHSKYAASRFAHEAAPALSRIAESSPEPFIDGIVQHGPHGERDQQSPPRDVLGQLLDRHACLDVAHVRLAEHQLVEGNVAQGAEGDLLLLRHRGSPRRASREPLSRPPNPSRKTRPTSPSKG